SSWAWLFLSRRRSFLCRRGHATRAQAVDFARAEAQLFQDLLIVLTEPWGAPGRHFGDAMNLDRAADRRIQFAAGALERNDNVVDRKLRILDDLLRPLDGAEGDVNTAEDLVPVRHRLCAKDFVENGAELRHVCHQLLR